MSVAEAFGRAVDYDRHAELQRHVAARLAQRILALPLPRRPRLLEFGCGTGLLGAALVDRLPEARWRMTDISPAMVARARHRLGDRPHLTWGAMDGEHPDVAGPFDLVCSSLAAQWFGDLGQAVRRLRALLAPDGILAFTTLAAGSLHEWRDAHGALPCGVRDYPSSNQLADLGLEVTMEDRIVRHGNARSFLRALKGIGAGTPAAGHRPLSPAALRCVMGRFEAAGSRATYRVATCLARATTSETPSCG